MHKIIANTQGNSSFSLVLARFTSNQIVPSKSPIYRSLAFAVFTMNEGQTVKSAFVISVLGMPEIEIVRALSRVLYATNEFTQLEKMQILPVYLMLLFEHYTGIKIEPNTPITPPDQNLIKGVASEMRVRIHGVMEKTLLVAKEFGIPALLLPKIRRTVGCGPGVASRFVAKTPEGSVSINPTDPITLGANLDREMQTIILVANIEVFCKHRAKKAKELGVSPNQVLVSEKRVVCINTPADHVWKEKKLIKQMRQDLLTQFCQAHQLPLPGNKTSVKDSSGGEISVRLHFDRSEIALHDVSMFVGHPTVSGEVNPTTYFAHLVRILRSTPNLETLPFDGFYFAFSEALQTEVPFTSNGGYNLSTLTVVPESVIRGINQFMETLPADRKSFAHCCVIPGLSQADERLGPREVLNMPHIQEARTAS